MNRNLQCRQSPIDRSLMRQAEVAFPEWPDDSDLIMMKVAVLGMVISEEYVLY